MILIVLLCILSFEYSFESDQILTEKDADYWNRMGRDEVRASVNIERNLNNAKNIIFFLGDGMGVSTTTAARIYKAQKSGKYGSNDALVWDNFPHLSMLKTYALDRMVPDSAATATAYLSGVKTNFLTLGVSGRAKYNDCNSSIGAHVDSIAAKFIALNRDVGIVSTASVTDASIAATYAHVANRRWEYDASMPKDAVNCKDIASQLVEDFPGNKFKVILAGGKQYFSPVGMSNGVRRDGKNLIKKWLKNKRRETKSKVRFVQNRKEFDAAKASKTDYLLGLFGLKNMAYEVKRKELNIDQPSLSEMTKKAIEILSKGDKGYFLFVEGGLIDKAHHANQAKRVLEDTLELENSVKTALEMVNLNETLIIVTADHSHGMTINGYPHINTSILGVATPFPGDKLLHTTLLYSSGPGNINSSPEKRASLTKTFIADNDYRQASGFRAGSAAHTGEDVQVFATGPMSHMFFGVHEQSYLAHAMEYASCTGEYSNEIRCS